MTQLGQVTATERGFPLVKFKDHYGADCSIQESSLMVEGGAIWLGVNSANPHILASRAAEFGIKTSETTGWVPYPVPPEVLMCTRMHLTKDQVKSLIAHLQAWIDTDSFEIPNENYLEQ